LSGHATASCLPTANVSDAQSVGVEARRPLATVVVGGLYTSTALPLLLLALFYEWVETRRAAARERRRGVVNAAAA